MPRSNASIRGAIVMAIAFSVLACAGRPRLVPAPPALYPGPTPAPVVPIDPGAKYAEALVAALAIDPLVLRVVQTAKLKGLYELDGASANLTTTLDISGRAMDIHIVSKSAGKTTKIDLVVVGKTVFGRVGGSPWKKVRRSDFEQDITDVVRGLQLIRNPAYLTYVGIETIDKHKLHHLKANRTFPYITGTASGTYDKFDVWIKEDGTPVLVRGKVSAVAEYGFEIAGSTEMRFSKFGGPIKIVAPKN
jgi:hypothetical protein